MDIDNFQDSIYRNRGISMQGLQSLYIHVHTPNAHAAFYENRCVSVLSHGEEMDRLLKEAHTQRMVAIKAAFPAFENKLREVGIEIIPNEEGVKNPALSCLVITLDLGKPEKKASFSASVYLEQEVQLVCDPGVKFRVKTWEGGISKYKYKHNGIEVVLNSCLDSFLFFYRYINQLPLKDMDARS